MANTYYSGQGSVYASKRHATSGAPLGFIAVGNVPELEVSIEVTKYEHKESESGSRSVDLAIVQEKKGTFRMLVENVSLENLAMGFWGQTVTTVAAADTQVDLIAPDAAGLAAGHYITLPTGNVSGVVAGDDDYVSGTPSTTYSFSTDVADKGNVTYDGYIDLKYGKVYPTAGGPGSLAGGETMMFEYTTVADTLSMEAFTENSLERFVRFEGLNTIDGEDDVLVEMYKVQLDPITGYQLINEEIAQLEITGSLLYDDKQAGTSKYFKQTIIT